MKIIRVIADVVIIIMFLLFVAVVVSKAVNKQTSETVTVTQGVTLPVAYKDAYLKECNIDGKMGTYCDCTLRYLETNYTTAEIMEMSAQVMEDNKVMPDGLMKAVGNCYYLIE